METTLIEKNRIREIISNLVQGNKDWIGEKLITISDKEDYWVLNYIQGQRNAYNRLVRGMVVKKPSHGWDGDYLDLIVSFPFTRFFNHGESDAADIDFLNSEMLEKMDGTMVGIFFPTKDLSQFEFHTRKLISASEYDMNLWITSLGRKFYGQKYQLMKLIEPYTRTLNFTADDLDYTYVFEFVHGLNQVLTEYPEDSYGFYLLGARNVKTHKELYEDELDKLAERLGCYRPRRFDALDDIDKIQEECQKLSKELEDFEGFIFRDKETGHRLKLKSLEYVKKHHLLGNASYARLLERVIAGEEEEIVACLSFLKEPIELVKQKYNDYLNMLVEKVKFWKAKNHSSQKELAIDILGGSISKKDKTKKLNPKEPRDVASYVLRYASRNEDDLYDLIDQDLKNKSYKTLAEMIGLKTEGEVDEIEDP